MADTKISALTALTGANLASTDEFVVLDVSDTTMSADGTDKAIPAAELEAGIVALQGWRKRVRKGSDESVTSSAVLQDDNDLLFAIGANQVWVGRIVLYVTGHASGDIQAALTVPASPDSVHYGGHGLIRTATTNETGMRANVQATAGAAVSFGLVTGETCMVTIDFEVDNGSNAGNVQLQWAQLSSHATATTVLTGSYLIADRMA